MHEYFSILVLTFLTAQLLIGRLKVSYLDPFCCPGFFSWWGGVAEVEEVGKVGNFRAEADFSWSDKPKQNADG